MSFAKVVIRNNETAMVPSANLVGVYEDKQGVSSQREQDNKIYCVIENILKPEQDKNFNEMKGQSKGSRFIFSDSPVSSSFIPYVALAITAVAAAVIFAAGFVAGCALSAKP